MSNNKRKPSSVYFKCTQENRFNTNYIFTYDTESNRDGESVMMTKLGGFPSIKKIWDHKNIGQN